MKGKRYAIVIDQKKCLGCQTCTIACCRENNVVGIEPWHDVLDLFEGEYPAIKRRFYPRPCQHCRNAPCVEACPTGASRKRPDGIVLIDEKNCIGCRYCIVACPYEARVFNWKKPEKALIENLAVPRKTKGTTSKCTFCVHRIEQAARHGRPVGDDAPGGVVPACNEQCPGKARYFGDLNDAGSLVARLVATRSHVRLLENRGTDPSVIYLT